MILRREREKKKVLLVNKYFHPVIGGVETVVRQYAMMLRDAGYDVTVLSAKRNFSLVDEISRDEGVRAIRCASFGTFFSMPVSISFLVFLFLNYRRYDYLHFHEPFPLGSLAALLRFGNSQRVIVTWHSDIVKQKLLKNAVGVFQRLLLRKAHAITATSPIMASRSALIREYPGKTTVIPLSIDAKEYGDPGGALPQGVRKDDYILYLGRLSYYKGLPVLLEAYRDSRVGMPLVIAGQGDEGRRIRSFLASNPSLKIHFIEGYVEENAKKHLLANCAFFVLPSIQSTEAFAIVQLEAMIFGKPVLNTDLPTGVPWVSRDGETGITVPPGDVKGLASAIMALAASPSVRKAYGKAAELRVAEHFDDAAISRQLIELYRNLDPSPISRERGNHEARPA